MFVELAKFAKAGVYRVLLVYVLPPLARLFGYQVVHFLHIGKTGGTAVKQAFDAYPFPWHRFGSLLIVFHDHHTALQDLPANDRFFLFVRDPVARFVSGFDSRKRCGRPRRLVPWSRRERRAFVRFARPGDLADGLLADDPETRHEAVQAMHAIEHVRSQQISWIGGSIDALERRRDRLVVLGRQETLQRDFEKLKTALGLPAALALPESGRTAHRSQTSEQLKQRQAAEIAAWYQPDYALLSWIEDSGRRPRAASAG